MNLRTDARTTDAAAAAIEQLRGTVGALEREIARIIVGQEIVVRGVTIGVHPRVPPAFAQRSAARVDSAPAINAHFVSPRWIRRATSSSTRTDRARTAPRG